MAISFIQSGSVTGSNGLSLAFSSNNAAGNCLIAAVMANTSATFAVSDTQGNVYQHLAALFDGSGAVQLQIFYMTSCRAGANTVNFDPGTAAAAASAMAIHEFSGVPNLDVSASAAGNGTSVDSGPATTTTATELLFGYFAGQGTSLVSVAEGAGYTRAQSVVFASGTMAFLTEYQIVNSVGSYDATGSAGFTKGFSYTWGAEIAAFKSAPGFSSGGLCLMGVGA